MNGYNQRVYQLYHYSLNKHFNLSITTGAVPDEMKIACLIPLYKSGAHNVFTNYRPVLILPAFSKILEKIMYKRLLAFLDTT